jgi:FtsP/CotA-like multicopper oxidase with cupredoxin domain
MPRWALADNGGQRFPSPFLRPFAQELPVPPVVQPSAPDLPPTTVWGYQDANAPDAKIFPGNTFVGRQGTPRVVRFTNDLPGSHQGFGVPNMVVHRHGGNQASEDDGYPLDLFRPGESRDFVWPDHLEDERDVTQGTLWYHDHLIDFTAQNVYHGLAGFYIRYSDVDTGNENTPGTTGLRLPSAPYDVALVIQDRVFNGDGSFFYDLNQHDGMLGDRFLVNGAVQPFFRVRRRKYRFRILNGSNARFYELFLSNGMPFVQIGVEGGFLEFPFSRQSILIAPAERVEIIVDFTNAPQGSQIVLENRLRQDDGRGPSGDFDNPERTSPTPLLRFDVDGTAPDASVIPTRLRAPLPGLPPPVNRRHFEFARSNGAWQINDRFFDGNRVDANPRVEEPEIWTLKNGGGGWWHPIHIHLSSFEILRRNGRTPPPFERAMKEVVTLGPGDEVDLLVKFQNFRGRYVMHCHNIEHEDLAMMIRWDSV